MTDPDQHSSAPLGRALLLASAYSPALVIVGLRVDPTTTVGALTIAAGLLGSVAWLVFLLGVLPHAQPREVVPSSIDLLDRDVTGYVASYLLPVLAVKPADTWEQLAYALAAVVVLVVAFRADLGAVNPLAYFFGFRVYRVTANGGPVIALSKVELTAGVMVTIARKAGVTRVIPSDEASNQNAH